LIYRQRPPVLDRDQAVDILESAGRDNCRLAKRTVSGVCATPDKYLNKVKYFMRLALIVSHKEGVFATVFMSP
jgi:hypothetical protein